ncbi:MAG: SpoIIE family protein phosphatase [Clostridia bacterium]|nr:SpoIIE family protein phosphatase [Clostridia bacterium]
MTIFRLVTSALFPVAIAAVIYLLTKDSKFKDFSYAKKQIIIGVVFGISACLATQFGIPYEGFVLNVRGASPLAAGLLFGAPAGVIAGVIGGIYRWFSVYWGVGSYTQLACSLGTIIAGLAGAACHKYMFDKKKPGWFYGLFIGASVEVAHMLLVFTTHINDMQNAFEVVRICAVPMISANGLSVMLSCIVVSALAGEINRKKLGKKQITQTFSVSLLICVIIAYIATSAFTFVLQNSISKTDVEETLRKNVTDVEKDVLEASDHNLLQITRNIRDDVIKDELYKVTPSDKEQIRAQLTDMLEKYNVTDINIVDENGIITVSSYAEFDDFDFTSQKDGQSAEFTALLKDDEEIVQQYGPLDYDKTIERKYAGVKLPNGFVQVGYDFDHFKTSIEQEVRLAANNRHIGDTGYIFILDQRTGEVISAPEGTVTSEKAAGFIDTLKSSKALTVLNAENEEGKLYCMHNFCEGYIIAGCISVNEAHFSRNVSIYIGIFMQVVVFVTLFVLIYILIKKIIIDNIHEINNSLSQITGGNLDTKVNVRDNEEFASLSDDINSTVDTLKDYISQAEKRMDEELKFAKNIQHSALPSVFPAYPNRREFDIYASMNTAKEVGGDFYDFYFVGKNTIAVLMADVSGKGIPAAMFMMTAKTMIKNLAETGLPVQEVLTQANEKLCETNEAGMFVTTWLGFIDLTTGKLTYANAGHNPPLLKRGKGKFEYLKGRSGLVLAGMEGVVYRANEVDLWPGDKLYLYTDGVTEATNSETQLYGEDRLVDLLNSQDYKTPEESCKAVLQSVMDFTGEADQFDDITMLQFDLYEIKTTEEIVVIPDTSSIPRVTEFVEKWMGRSRVDQRTINKVNVVIDEIYSNIAYYSKAGWASVKYNRDDDNIYLTFTDDGSPYNPLEKEDPDITLSAEEREIGGLGVFMVKKIMDNVDYKYEDGKNVLKLTKKI